MPRRTDKALAARRSKAPGAFPNILESSRVSRRMEKLKLSELKAKSPAELLTFAEEYEGENASTMR